MISYEYGRESWDDWHKTDILILKICEMDYRRAIEVLIYILILLVCKSGIILTVFAEAGTKMLYNNIQSSRLAQKESWCAINIPTYAFTQKTLSQLVFG